MKFFLDQEFIEYFRRPLFGKRRHVIDLVSIGIMAEDGRKYYAVSKEFNLRNADQWLRDNVLPKIYWDWCYLDDESQAIGMYSMWGSWQGDMEFNRLKRKFGKTNGQIADEVYEFVNPHYREHVVTQQNNFACASADDMPPLNPYWFEYVDDNYVPNKAEFYGYYADYDWVLFCSLFGRMEDLPDGFQKYCVDLQQMIVAKALEFKTSVDRFKSEPMSVEHILDIFKKFAEYPRNNNEHNALHDAKWNKNLYDFIQTISFSMITLN